LFIQHKEYNTIPEKNQCYRTLPQLNYFQVNNKPTNYIKVYQLEGRNLNITTQLTSIINVFKDFKLMQELREEIAKVKPCLISTLS